MARLLGQQFEQGKFDLTAALATTWAAPVKMIITKEISRPTRAERPEASGRATRPTSARPKTERPIRPTPARPETETPTRPTPPMAYLLVPSYLVLLMVVVSFTHHCIAPYDCYRYIVISLLAILAC